MPSASVCFVGLAGVVRTKRDGVGGLFVVTCGAVLRENWYREMMSSRDKTTQIK